MLKKLGIISVLLLSSFGVFSAEVAAEQSKVEVKASTEEHLNFARLAIGTTRSTETVGMNLDARLNVEVGVDRNINKYLSLGAFASRNSKSEHDLLGLGFTLYRIGAVAALLPTKDSFIGVRGGIALMKISGTLNVVGLEFNVNSDTVKPFFAGLVAGLNIPINDKLLFTPSFSYDQFFKNSDLNDKFYQFDAMAALKYNF